MEQKNRVYWLVSLISYLKDTNLSISQKQEILEHLVQFKNPEETEKKAKEILEYLKEKDSK